jgi:glycosyltransferase involved in cell wall biosynthesis
MKISIVTISYNQVRFLEQAICSVLEQDYSNIEYILVDPGSTDGSRELIEKYRDRISKIVFDPDNGPADGLNKGFSFATGDLYGFLNSDDFLLPGAISHVVACFTSDPSVDVVSGHAIVVDEFGKKLRKVYSDRFGLIEAAYGAGILMQPSTFFQSRIYNKVNGFNINNRTNWDDELFIDIKLCNGIFKLTNKFLSAYRIHSSSITGAANNHTHINIQNYCANRFKKIMGRKKRWYDNLAELLFLIVKYIKTPLSVYERMRYGPVYRRFYHGK